MSKTLSRDDIILAALRSLSPDGLTSHYAELLNGSPQPEGQLEATKWYAAAEARYCAAYADAFMAALKAADDEMWAGT